MSNQKRTRNAKPRAAAVVGDSAFAARCRGIHDSKNADLCNQRIERYKQSFLLYRNGEYEKLEKAQEDDRIRSAQLVSVIGHYRDMIAVKTDPPGADASESDRKNYLRKLNAKDAAKKALSQDLAELSKLNDRIESRQNVVRARINQAHAVYCGTVSTYVIGVLKKNKGYTVPDFGCGNGFTEYLEHHKDDDNARAETIRN